MLRDDSDGGTRLIVRERFGYTKRWAALVVEPTELVSFLMSQRMLRGIRHRSERPTDPQLKPEARCPSSPPTGQRATSWANGGSQDAGRVELERNG